MQQNNEQWVEDSKVSQYLSNGYTLAVDESFIKSGIITKSCKLGEKTLMVAPAGACNCVKN